jgi:hypothetical protein
MSCTASVAGFELITEGLVNPSTQKPGGGDRVSFRFSDSAADPSTQKPAGTA